MIVQADGLQPGVLGLTMIPLSWRSVNTIGVCVARLLTGRAGVDIESPSKTAVGGGRADVDLGWLIGTSPGGNVIISICGALAEKGAGSW